MKTLEVLDAIMKDKQKEFKTKGCDGRNFYAKQIEECEVKNGVMYDAIVGYTEDMLFDAIPLCINATTINYDWEEVKQPYTFLEAYEDCEKNGNNYYKINDPQIKLLSADDDVLIHINNDWKNVATLTAQWYKED